jgi:mannosyltransferase OCH1-like enzyme
MNINKRQLLINYKKMLIIKKLKQRREMERQENERKNNTIYNEFMKLNKQFEMKETYNSIIPKQVYMCWYTLDLPPKMLENYNYMKQINPELTFNLYDDEMCRDFIKTNFEQDVLIAFDKLIPGAYKADLWRYCVLYKLGGIYLDIKYRCVNNFKLIALTEQEYFVRDRDNIAVYNALIATKPNNEIMLKCINQIVENVKNKYYGINYLSPTGPMLVKSYFSQEEINKFSLYHNYSKIENKLNEYYITMNNKINLIVYKEYREEQNIFQNKPHYSTLWNNKQIYYLID